MKYQFNWIHTDPYEDKKDCKYRIDKNKCDIKKKKCSKCPFYVTEHKNVDNCRLL